MFLIRRRYKYVSLKIIINRGRGKHTVDNRFINDGDIYNLPQKGFRASNNFGSNILVEIIAAGCFSFHGKNTVGGFIYLWVVNIWRIDGLFDCLRRITEGKNNTLTYSRKGNSESWKPPNSEPTVVSVVKCITALPEAQCCLDLLLSRRKKKNWQC